MEIIPAISEKLQNVGILKYWWLKLFCMIYMARRTHPYVMLRISPSTGWGNFPNILFNSNNVLAGGKFEKIKRCSLSLLFSTNYPLFVQIIPIFISPWIINKKKENMKRSVVKIFPWLWKILISNHRLQNTFSFNFNVSKYIVKKSFTFS